MVGVTGLEPAASRSQSARSTTELHPVNYYGAEGETRTPTALRPTDFKSVASTSYATPEHTNILAAGLGFEPRLMASKATVLPLDDPAMRSGRDMCGRRCNY